MIAPLDIVVPGGELIIASECSEGIGSEEYRAAQRRLIDAGTDGFERAIAAQAQAEIDEWQTQMQLKPMRHARVSLYCPGLGEADFALTGVARADSIAAAVSASVLRSGSNRVAVIPEGPYLVPVYHAAA
jgi:nickel-dependent lactate racemase